MARTWAWQFGALEQCAGRRCQDVNDAYVTDTVIMARDRMFVVVRMIWDDLYDASNYGVTIKDHVTLNPCGYLALSPTLPCLLSFAISPRKKCLGASQCSAVGYTA